MSSYNKTKWQKMKIKSRIKKFKRNSKLQRRFTLHPLPIPTNIGKYEIFHCYALYLLLYTLNGLMRKLSLELNNLTEPYESKSVRKHLGGFKDIYWRETLNYLWEYEAFMTHPMKYSGQNIHFIRKIVELKKEWSEKCASILHCWGKKKIICSW